MPKTLVNTRLQLSVDKVQSQIGSVQPRILLISFHKR